MTRALLQQALEALGHVTGDSSQKTSAEMWQDICNAEEAIEAELAKPEPCYCDLHNIGNPAVSCGDCPLRDYKPVQVPAWHSAPTCEGQWVNSISSRLIELEQDALLAWSKSSARWYGPIPKDAAIAAQEDEKCPETE